MTPISLMPPVGYCPSCEGRQAENVAVQVGEARARQAEATGQTEKPGASDSATVSGLKASSPIDAGLEGAGSGHLQPVAGTVKPLLVPDLAVQASLARPSVETGTGEAEALRLRTAQAYRTL